MNAVKRIFSRFRQRAERGDASEELQFHLEKEIEQNIARGLSPAEARRVALIALGGMQQTRERVREVRWMNTFDVLAHDFKYAWRMLRKSPGVTAIAILTLGLGIGMNTAIFSLINAALFRALPVLNPEELVLLRYQAGHRGKIHSHSSHGDCPNHRLDGPSDGCSFSLPFFEMLRARKDLFSGIAAYSGADKLDLSGNGAATIVNGGLFVSGEYFATLGIKPASGRTLQRSDEEPAAPPVMVLGYDYWKNAFGSAPDVVGRVVRLNTIPFTIVGVADPGFPGLTPGHKVDLWMPLSSRRLLDPRWTPDEDDGGSWWLVIVARTRPDISLRQAQAAASLLYADETLHEEKPLFAEADAPTIKLVPAQQGLSGERTSFLPPLYILMLAAGLVLLIACANIAGLLVARSAGRTKEIAVRLTLGARRSRLISQLLMESLLLSMLGGVLGLLLAHWGARELLLVAGATQLPFTPQLDFRVLGFTAVTAVLTGILFGLLPALRSLKLDLTPALKSGAGGTDSGFRNKWYSMGKLLVVSQVSLAIVTLVVAGLLVRTLRNLKGVDLGFDSDKLLVFALDPSLAGYKGTQIAGVFRDLQEEIAAQPGVRSVTYSWTSLLSGSQWDIGFHAAGTPEKEESDTDYMPVGPHFFESMRIPLRAGRDFNAADFAAAAARAAIPPGAKPDPNAAPTVVIVNETFVRRFLHNTTPLGQHVEAMIPEDSSQPRAPGWEIIGVAGDARYESLRGEMYPTMYAASGGNASFSVRTAGDPMAIVPSIRALIQRRDANLAMTRVATEEQQIESQVVTEKLVARLSSFFGLLALALACTGIYGLLSYEVTRRTREIGIRMAIGAQAKDVVRMVVRQGLLLALAGAVIGAITSLAVRPLVAAILYRVKAGDPVTLASVAVILLVVALAACYLPARRATRVDPLVALRYE